MTATATAAPLPTASAAATPELVGLIATHNSYKLSLDKGTISLDDDTANEAYIKAYRDVLAFPVTTLADVALKLEFGLEEELCGGQSHDDADTAMYHDLLQKVRVL
ncbi:hypothetical protein N9M66_00350 [Litoreibacter sp.]|nr:hypothetical protein [Litoreibacter sp.]